MDNGKAGICPCCGEWVEYGDSDNAGDYISYDWDCPRCGASGKQYDTVTFESMELKDLHETKPNLVTPDV